MAKLNQPESAGFEIGDLAPAGTYIATCLDIQDRGSLLSKTADFSVG